MHTVRKKQTEDEDGLTAKQRRKIVSKAIISSSDSDSEAEKLKIAHSDGGMICAQILLPPYQVQ